MAKPENIWALLWDLSFNRAEATMPEMMILPIKQGRYMRMYAVAIMNRHAEKQPQPRV